MQQFTLKDIETISGLKSYTIHMLVQHYNLLQNFLVDNKRKRYSLVELITILNISFLYHSGLTLAQIAAFSKDELHFKSKEIRIDANNNQLNSIKLLINVFNLEITEAKHHIENLIDLIGAESCITLVCYPALNRLKNEIVERNNLIVQKRLLYNLVQNKIITATDEVPQLAISNQTVVLFSPSDKKNNLSLLYLHYLLKKYNWTVLYIGSNITLNHIEYLKENPMISHLYIHIKDLNAGYTIDDYCEIICTTFSTKQIVISGATALSLQRSFVNLRLLQSDREINEYIKTHQPLGNT